MPPWIELNHYVLLLLMSIMTWFLPGMVPIKTTDTTGTTSAHVVRVIDGDTIDVKLAHSKEVIRVRYIGIDTPESGEEECGSKEATQLNRDLVLNQTVEIVPGTDRYDDYGRLLAYVYSNGVFVNEELMKEGYATTMTIEPNSTTAESFQELESQAREYNKGIWGTLCSKNEILFRNFFRPGQNVRSIVV